MLMIEFLRNDHQPTNQPTNKAGSRDAIASKNVPKNGVTFHHHKKANILPFSGTLCMSIEEVNQQKCISHYVININRNGITSTVVLSGHGWVIVHWWGLLVIL